MLPQEKKILIFILEGENDKKYIEAIYSIKGLRKKYVPIYIWTGGDITSRTQGKDKVDKDKLRQVIWGFIEDWFNNTLPNDKKDYHWGVDKNGRRRPKVGCSEKNNNNYNPQKDIEAIIQIIDTDGRFVSDEQVVQDDLLRDNELVYTEDCIKCANKAKFFNEKNARKNLLDSLLKQSFHGELNKKSKKKPTGIGENYTLNDKPHYVFYMSCNCEHVFFGKEFMSISGTEDDVRKEKAKKADEFQNNPEQYLNLTFSNPQYTYQYDFNKPSWENNYEASWSEIGYYQDGVITEQGINSLKRKTNLNLLFRKYSG